MNTNSTQPNESHQDLSTKPQNHDGLVESTGFHVTGSIKITDVDTGNVLLHKRIDE
jgi:hypothetical protein